MEQTKHLILFELDEAKKVGGDVANQAVSGQLPLEASEKRLTFADQIVNSND